MRFLHKWWVILGLTECRIGISGRWKSSGGGGKNCRIKNVRRNKRAGNCGTGNYRKTKRLENAKKNLLNVSFSRHKRKSTQVVTSKRQLYIRWNILSRNVIILMLRFPDNWRHCFMSDASPRTTEYVHKEQRQCAFEEPDFASCVINLSINWQMTAVWQLLLWVGIIHCSSMLFSCFTSVVGRCRHHHSLIASERPQYFDSVQWLSLQKLSMVTALLTRILSSTRLSFGRIKTVRIFTFEYTVLASVFKCTTPHNSINSRWFFVLLQWHGVYG